MKKEESLSLLANAMNQLTELYATFSHEMSDEQKDNFVRLFARIPAHLHGKVLDADSLAVCVLKK